MQDLTPMAFVQAEPRSVEFGMNDGMAELIQSAQESLGISAEDTDMYLYDQPEPNQAVAQVVVVAKNQASSTKHVLGSCNTVFVDRNYDENSVDLSIVGSANSYFAIKKISFKFVNPLIQVVQQPKHGVILPEDDWYNAKYIVNPKLYDGKDVVIAEVKEGDVSVRLYYFLKITEDLYTPTCQGAAWVISKDSAIETSDTESVAAWLHSAELSSLLANASQSLTGFQDLAGSAVGETTGEGPAAQITLDTTAAGHNWYVDPTPLDNLDDYLPTSNPDIWQAKAGTDGTGKMDMLSVLLHEYGHALGLEHSAQVGDFMSATLQPGERRLPNADELALMSQLVAQIKASQADAAAQSDALADPSAPASPGNPLSMLGLLPLGFVRRNGAATGTVHTDYLTAIQPTLTNGSFAKGLAQWESTGAVSTAGADAAHYTVTLSESSPTSTGQTHVGQAFLLGATDRFLSFTVSGLNLQSNSDAQDAAYTTAQDAFEVALLNANTGTSQLGGLGALPIATRRSTSS